MAGAYSLSESKEAVFHDMCSNPPSLTPFLQYCSEQFDAERIRQMKACVSTLPNEIKDYIRRHCGWCTDRACAIPHMAAG